MRLIRAHDPDVIVSTYPGVTAVLGDLRRKGKLTVPCYSSITDLAGLSSGPIPGSTCTSSPTRNRPRRSSRSPGRAACVGQAADTAGIPRGTLTRRCAPFARPARAGPVIAVSGGGWGVGDLIGATGAALAFPDATVLCLCGRNDRAARAGRRARSAAIRGCG